MSKKPKNRNKKHHQQRSQTRRELEELIKACNDGLDVGYVSFYTLVKRYKEGTYRDVYAPSKLLVIDDYIKSAQADLARLDSDLKDISLRARDLVKNYTNPEDDLMTNIALSQEFEDWSTSYQTNVTPTLLELVAYLDDLDTPTNKTETNHE